MQRPGLAFVALLAAAGPACSTRKEAPPEAGDGGVAAERERRQTPIAEIAPAPVPAPAAPSGGGDGVAMAPLPLLGEDALDRYGYPKRYVDRPALRGLLLRRRYAELTAAVERLQDGFERDPRREYWPDDAAEALGTGEWDLKPFLDGWVEASPDSFAPYLARGTYWVRAGFARRGGKWAAETPSQDFASMDEALARAAPDLARAVEIRPGLVAAMRQQLNLNLPSARGRRENERVIARALRACPSCILVRATYLHTLAPRWGGSYGAMRRFARRRPERGDLMARLLPGYVDLERAHDLRDREREREALAAVERACALGEHWEFYLERARQRLRMREVAAALPDLDRAAVLRPGHPDVLYWRADALARARRWEEAGRALRDGIQVSPVHWMARSPGDKLLDTVVKGLAHQGWERHRAGDREGALRAYDLAAELAPDDHEVQNRRAAIVVGGKPDAAAAERAGGVPDDFRAVQQLDYQLARQGQFERVVAVWNDFLARHPDHGQAYLERGGAQYHLRRLPEALADAQRACDLGVSEGCVRARQLRGGR